MLPACSVMMDHVPIKIPQPVNRKVQVEVISHRKSGIYYINTFFFSFKQNGTILNGGLDLLKVIGLLIYITFTKSYTFKVLFILNMSRKIYCQLYRKTNIKIFNLWSHLQKCEH